MPPNSTNGNCRRSEVLILLFSGIALIYFFTTTTDIIPVDDTYAKNLASDNVRNHTADRGISDPDIVETCPLGVRKEHLARMCHQWPQIKSIETADNIITDSGHRLLYCEVSKVACTTVKTTWELANTNWTKISPVAVHDTNRMKVAGLNTKNRFVLNNDTSGFAKFIVVRHPIDRLISGYKNLLHFNGNGPVHATQPLIKMFHLEQQGIGALTFSMFLQAIVDEKFSFYNDRHWKPYSLTCNPCNIHYDYVIRTETMQQGPEMIQILMRLNYSTSAMENIINPGKRNLPNETASTNNKQFRTTTNYRTIFQDVPEWVLRKLHHRYRDDMLLFGYTFDMENYSFSCGIQHQGGTCC